MTFYKSPEWNQIKIDKLKSVSGFICEFCNFTAERCLHFHHIEYPENFKDTKSEQLVILCACCHTALHFLQDMAQITGKKFSINPCNKETLDDFKKLLIFLKIPRLELTEKRIARAQENKEKFLVYLESKKRIRPLS